MSIKFKFLLGSKQLFDVTYEFEREVDQRAVLAALREAITDEISALRSFVSLGVIPFSINSAEVWLKEYGIETSQIEVFRDACPAISQIHIDSQIHLTSTLFKQAAMQSWQDGLPPVVEQHLSKQLDRQAVQSQVKNTKDDCLIAPSEVISKYNGNNEDGSDFLPKLHVIKVQSDQQRYAHVLSIATQFNEGGVVFCENEFVMKDLINFIKSSNLRVIDASEMLHRFSAKGVFYFYIANPIFKTFDFEFQYAIHVELPSDLTKYIDQSHIGAIDARYVDSFIIYSSSDQIYQSRIAKNELAILQKEYRENIEKVRKYCIEKNCRAEGLIGKRGICINKCDLCNADTSAFGSFLPKFQESALRWTRHPLLKELCFHSQNIFEIGYSVEFTGPRGSNAIYSAKSLDRDFSPEIIERSVKFLQERFPLQEIDCITFVPPTTSGGKVERFAESLGAEIGRKTVQFLKKDPNRVKQKTLTDIDSKLANVKGAYSEIRSPLRQNILIIDDVFDSGLTLAEVGRTLKMAGSGKLYAMTIAKTPLGD